MSQNLASKLQGLLILDLHEFGQSHLGLILQCLQVWFYRLSHALEQKLLKTVLVDFIWVYCKLEVYINLGEPQTVKPLQAYGSHTQNQCIYAFSWLTSELSGSYITITIIALQAVLVNKTDCSKQVCIL